ncbi:MAG: protein-L-isoaspartate(D-aspartate) O-methyltransferase [Planctomycetota bacterium]|nr:protein-L-isoaspartate(D-aspartate) O-methyltransferase [Planctomycetota bacterium]
MSDAYQARLAMVRDQIESRKIRDPAVLAAMRTVPRHLFVPADAAAEAYGDHALGIGWKGTISQPYVVAHMTELCELKAGDRVLEVGTGSGYQAAVLAEITDRVLTIEISEPLLRRAALRLTRLHYDVKLRWGDGGHGWPEAAPFDAIVVTAAPAHRVPQALFDQLAPGGRLVAPVGEARQRLELFVRRDGKIVRSRGAGVRFVPMVGTGSV